MKEYTIFAVFSVAITLILSNLLKTQVFKRKEFYLFLLVILAFKFLVNGYLTASCIVVYNPETFLGIRIGSIPLEDFLFGFSMVTMTIVFWEKLKEK